MKSLSLIHILLGVPHHLLGILPPGERFSVAEYVTLAASCIEKIAARGHLPVLAGGTGLYLRSLLQNRPFSDEPENPEIRDVYKRQILHCVLPRRVQTRTLSFRA